MDNMNDNVNRWKEQLEKSDDAKTSSSGEKTKDEESEERRGFDFI